MSGGTQNEERTRYGMSRIILKTSHESITKRSKQNNVSAHKIQWSTIRWQNSIEHDENRADFGKWNREKCKSGVGGQLL